jgi:hypothetical protein
MNYAINSKIMGMENLMVTLGKRYYLNGLTEWSDSTWLKNLEEEIYMKIPPDFTPLGLM